MGRRLRVLLMARPGTGGAARHVRDVVRGLAPRHELTVLASPLEDPAFPAQLRTLGAEVRPVKLARGPSLLRDAAALATLGRELWRRRYDVIHAHAAKAGALARTLAATTPVVYSPHGFFHDYPTEAEGALTAAAGAELALARRTGVLALCADWERDLARRRGLVPGPWSRVIPNGVPLRRPASKEVREQVRRGLLIAPADRLVLMAGRLAPPKTPGLFTEAARSAPPGVRYVLAGGGPWLGRLRKRSGGALVLGHREDVPRLLEAADAAVLSSRFEAAPYFLLEAMASGVPVVATDLPATREMVGDAGVLVPHGSARALAEGVAQALSRPDLGERGRERVASRYTVAHMLDATEEAWQAARTRRLPSG